MGAGENVLANTLLACFSAWLPDMVLKFNVLWSFNLLFSYDETAFFAYVSCTNRKLVVSPSLICFFPFGIFHSDSLLVHVGWATPVNTAASTWNNNSATWLQLPIRPAVQVQYALFISPTSLSLWSFLTIAQTVYDFCEILCDGKHFVYNMQYLLSSLTLFTNTSWTKLYVKYRYALPCLYSHQFFEASLFYW